MEDLSKPPWKVRKSFPGKGHENRGQKEEQDLAGEAEGDGRWRGFQVEEPDV